MNENLVVFEGQWPLQIVAIIHKLCIAETSSRAWPEYKVSSCLTRLRQFQSVDTRSSHQSVVPPGSQQQQTQQQQQHCSAPLATPRQWSSYSAFIIIIEIIIILVNSDLWVGFGMTPRRCRAQNKQSFQSNHENSVFNWGYSKRCLHLGRFCAVFCLEPAVAVW